MSETKEKFNPLAVKIIIPFGRFASKLTKSGEKKLFIAREKTRALLIDRLISGESRGAYLVTGRRGVGKTSFVEACLEEYSNSVYMRFLRAGHGRGLPNLLLTALFFIFLLAAYLAASGMLELTIASANDNFLLYPAVAILFLICLSPLFLAYSGLSALSQLFFKRIRGFKSVMVAILILFALMTLAILGSVAYKLSAAILIPVIDLVNDHLHLLLSMKILEPVTLITISHPSALGITLKSTLLALIIIVLLGRMQFFGSFRYVKALPGFANLAINTVLAFLVIILSLIIITLGDNYFHRNSYLIYVANLYILEQYLLLENASDSVVKFTTWTIVLGGAWLVRVLILLATDLITKVDNGNPRIDYLMSITVTTCLLSVICDNATIIVLVSLLIGADNLYLILRCILWPLRIAIIWLLSKIKKIEPTERKAFDSKLYAPPFEAILMLKAFFLVVGAVQLAYPIINLEVPFREKIIGELFSGELRAYFSSTSNSYFAGEPLTELRWLALSFLGLVVIFLAEYNWIMRPFMAERENPVLGQAKKELNAVFSHHDADRWPSSKDKLNRTLLDRFILSAAKVLQKLLITVKKICSFTNANSSKDGSSANNDEASGNSRKRIKQNAEQIENFRAVTKITFPWLVISAWMPTIIVRINLGFEVLKHQSVIFAMLHGMRTQYKRKLFSPLATSTLLINSVKFILLLLVVNMVAHYSFGLYNLAEIDYNHTINASENSKMHVHFYNFDQTNINYQQNFSETTARKIDYCDLLTIPPSRAGKRYEGDENTRDSSSTNKAIWTKALCSAWPDFTNSLLPILYLELLPIRLSEEHQSRSVGTEIERFVFWLFHDHHSLPEWVLEYDSERKELVPKFAANETISFRVYHALLLLVILAIWRWLSSVLPIAPYRRTLAQIDELLEKLTGKRSERRSRSYWAPMGYVRSLFMDNKSSAVEQEMQDPRSVELGFMELLEDIRRSDIRLPFGVNATASLATPEMTFVFDELDKISGSTSTSSGELNSTVIDQEISVMQAEVNRAYAMQNLLSDMKRLITAAPAKFIFVGNRLLHDEWTADQSRRQPLLSSIFDAEYYIPSLMTDTSTANATPDIPVNLSDRIAEFMVKRLWLAQDAHERFQDDRSTSFAMLNKKENSTSYSIDGPLGSSCIVRGILYHEYRTCRLLRRDSEFGTNDRYEEIIKDLDGSWHNEFLINLIRYLTYRSVGEPKSLELLINERARQFDRFVVVNSESLNIMRGQDSCRDVLYFNHTSLFHIQLITHIYQHLTERFSDRLTGRDDKIAVSLFYIFDFLLKFHDRAFSWANLERIDELAHIHRVPELQELLKELVEGSSERLLHPILNGMYNFRFRSEFAQEISYLSKVSLAEMSALNFTMDEAKSMKATYISELKESAGEDFDKINALGELYEFDQQHEQAREQYRKALNVLDQIMYQRLGHTVSTSKDSTEPNYVNNYHAHKRSSINKSNVAINVQSQPETQTIIRALLSWDENELENLLWAVPWGVRRIRLMLQIGMSFELAQDYERAKAHYIDARSLASAFFQLYELLLKGSEYEKIGGAKGWRLTVLKDILRHAHLLYQPFLAEAWLGEKMVEVINSSAVLLESELLRLRRTLPFVSQNDATFNAELNLFVDKGTNQDISHVQSFSLKNFGGGSGSSFSILLAELHNKTGDLYFYKGYQFMHSSANRNLALDSSKPIEHGVTGYLLRAHFHYAFALHELRRHNFYTKNISKYKYTLPRLDRDNTNTNSLASGQWALIIYQTTFNSLKDLADVTFVRGSTFDCWNGLPETSQMTLLTEKNGNKYVAIEKLIYDYGLYNAIIDWLESSDTRLLSQLKDHLSSQMSKCESISWGNIKLDRFTSTQHLKDIVLPLSLGMWQGYNYLSGLQPNKRDFISENYLRSLKFGKNSKPWQRLVFGLLCARASADFIAESGNASEAAYELLLLMERIRHVIHGFRIINWLNNEFKSQLGAGGAVNLSVLMASDAGKNETTGSLLNKEDSVSDSNLMLISFGGKHANFICFLADLLAECVQEYDKQAWLSWRRRPVSQADNNSEETKSFCFYKLNDAIAPLAATTLVSVLLDLQHFIGLFNTQHPNRLDVSPNLNKSMKATKRTLDSKLGLWLGGDVSSLLTKDFGCTFTGLGYRNILVYILKRHQYPVLNQLHALKALCDDIALSTDYPTQLPANPDVGEELLRYLEDMRILDENYAAPMHFTPYAYAESSALVALSGVLNSSPYNASRIHRRALEKLQQARSAYTMGKQYYANIRRMYYLYDDFNDRRMHANHALLMSSMEIASILEALLSEKDFLASAISE